MYTIILIVISSEGIKDREEFGVFVELTEKNSVKTSVINVDRV